MRLNSESGFRNRAYGIASKPQEAVKTEAYTDDGSASMDALKEDLKQYYESLGKYVEVGNYRPEEGRIGFYLTVSKSRSNPKIDVISFFYNTNTGKYAVTYNRGTKFFTDTESLKKYTKGLRLKTESARKCEALKLRVESTNQDYIIDKKQYGRIKSAVKKFFSGDRDSYRSGNWVVTMGGYDLVASLEYYEPYGTYSICGIFDDNGEYEIKDYHNSEFDFPFFSPADPIKAALDELNISSRIQENVERGIHESARGSKIPCDLVSAFVILRDYADVEDCYINEDHRLLVDIADAMYNVGKNVVDSFDDEYMEIYNRYGKAYFNKVLADINALDSQVSRDNVNDLIADVNGRLSAFDGGLDEALLIREQDTKIEVENPGVLEVPEGKNVDDLPLSHFVKLANKKGLSKITRALNNLQVWNKNSDPKLSKWAGDMIDKLKKKLGKEESVRFTESVDNQMYGYKLYNDMTDETFFVLADNKSDAVKYGKKLATIYAQEDVDELLNSFYEELPSRIIITDPEYDTLTRDRKSGNWTATLDSTGNDVEIITVGEYNSRF